SVSRLSLDRVLARGLAQARRRAFDIEYVVDNLEAETDGRRVTVECVVLVGTHRPATAGAEANRRPDERTGFEGVHAFEFSERERFARRREVYRLPAGHARGAGSIRKKRHLRRGIARRRACEQIEGQALQRVAGEQRYRLDERDM